MYYTEQVTSLMCAFLLKSIYTDKTNLEFTTFINAPVIAKHVGTQYLMYKTKINLHFHKHQSNHYKHQLALTRSL